MFGFGKKNDTASASSRSLAGGDQLERFSYYRPGIFGGSRVVRYCRNGKLANEHGEYVLSRESGGMIDYAHPSTHDMYSYFHRLSRSEYEYDE